MLGHGEGGRDVRAQRWWLEPVIGCDVRGGSCRRWPGWWRPCCAAAAVVVRPGLGAVARAAWEKYERSDRGPGPAACLESPPEHGDGYMGACSDISRRTLMGTGACRSVTNAGRSGCQARRACREGLEKPRTHLEEFGTGPGGGGGDPALKRFAGGRLPVSAGAARWSPVRTAPPAGARGPPAAAGRRCARGSYPRPGDRVRACRHGRWSAAASWCAPPRHR